MPKNTCVIGTETFEILEILKRDFFSTNVLLAQNGKKYVLKISTICFFSKILDVLLKPITKSIASWLSRREQRIYLKLHHIPQIPTIHSIRGRTFFLHEYVEGSPLSKQSKLAETFFDDLQELMAAVHSAGIAYMDLSKWENIIVTPEGKPALIDFQLSLEEKRNLWYPHELYNIFIRSLMKEDLYHCAKHRRSLRRSTMTPQDWECYYNRSFFLRSHRLLREPLLFFKRLIYPAGSDELRSLKKDRKRRRKGRLRRRMRKLRGKKKQVNPHK